MSENIKNKYLNQQIDENKIKEIEVVEKEIKKQNKYIELVANGPSIKMIFSFNPEGEAEKRSPRFVMREYEGGKEPVMKAEFDVYSFDEDVEKVFSCSMKQTQTILNYLKEGYFCLSIKKTGQGPTTKLEAIPFNPNK